MDQLPPLRAVLPLLLAIVTLDAAADPSVEPWPLPVDEVPAAQPNLVAQRGRLWLSWIERDGDAHRLRYAVDAGAGFDAARDIARGRDWFVNWADFPSLVALPDGSLAAHFLQKSADRPYAYDVRLTRSRDGEHWSAPHTVHDDGTPTEHGFASLWPWSHDEVAIAWLDGRATGGGHDGHEGHGADLGSAMTLRAAVFGADGKRDEWQLDAATCDCCQTDVALAAAGPLLVYRDRADGEIRDIALTRFRDGAWSAPRQVHADGWKMPACPVNGPAIAADGAAVAVAWYTAVDDAPQLRLALSHDDGATFAAPLALAGGTRLQGRVDVALDATHVFTSWLEEDVAAQTLWLERRARAGDEVRRVEVARLARGRGTGFPRLALRDGVAHLVWTDVVAQQPRLRGARVRFDGETDAAPGAR